MADLKVATESWANERLVHYLDLRAAKTMLLVINDSQPRYSDHTANLWYNDY